MNVRFQIFPVSQPLKGFIEKIWLFESPVKLPESDLRLVVPNGRPLLLIPYKNGLVGNMGDLKFIAAENKIALIGVCDMPSTIDSLTNFETGSIGIEFSPLGIYRFFHINLGELMNRPYLVVDVLGADAKKIEEEIANTAAPEKKVAVIQSYLLRLFSKKEEDSLFEFCIKRIEESAGSIPVKQLEKITGYSARWLNLKFKEKLGVSPKNFCSIIRFQNYYKSIINEASLFKTRRPYYHQYYDESHFIKDFKRFTGLPPTKLLEMENKFGKLFY